LPGLSSRYPEHAAVHICKLRSGFDLLTVKIVNAWPEAACGQFKDRQGDGQLKAPRPGASGIEIEHPVNGLDSRPMRVAGNDHVNTARRQVQSQFPDIVKHEDGASAEPHRLRVRIFFRPVSSVDVPSDRSDRSNPAQPGNDVWLTDIAAVDDMRNAREPLLSLRTQEAVSIRNDSNPEHSARIPSTY
jgi:hypothetical protein